MARREPGATTKKRGPRVLPTKTGTVQAQHGEDFLPPGGRRGRKPKGAGEAAGVPAISNYRPPTGKDTTLFQGYFKQAEAQDKVIDRQLKALQSAKQELGQIYRQAKEAGVPVARVAMMKRVIKERKMDAGEMLADARENAFQHTAMKSQVADVLPMAMLLAPPSLAEIGIMGEHAGKNGEPSDNNPWTPGTPQFVEWAGGHKKGQRESAGKVFGGKEDKGQGDGTGEAPAVASNVHRL